ncbi:hypothetical protein HDV00_006004 [Rhizophlyctis rosea]|nr:hypothetical protein HDV00_006004 [Rhizophlyctis rosea]
MGCPGSGKGTQTKRITANFGFTTVSTGDLLRKNINEGTPIGKEVESIISKGDLVSDDVVIRLVEQELERLEGKDWMLDGFPRTVEQAKQLDRILEKARTPLDIVINLDVPEEVILQRIRERFIHAPSGRTYNLSYNPPKVAGLDDVTGEPLTKRPDDNVETFKTRLDKYHSETSPLREYYQTRGILKNLPGRTSDEIYPFIDEELRELKAKLATHGRDPYLHAKQTAHIRSFSTLARRSLPTRVPSPPHTRSFTTTLTLRATSVEPGLAAKKLRQTAAQTFDVIVSLRRLLIQLFLWMAVLGMALETRWAKADMEEFLADVGVQKRRLERERERLVGVVEGRVGEVKVVEEKRRVNDVVPVVEEEEEEVVSGSAGKKPIIVW